MFSGDKPDARKKCLWLSEALRVDVCWCPSCVTVQDLLAQGPAAVSTSAAVVAAEADRPETFINLPGLQDRLSKHEIDRRQRALVLGAHPNELFRTGTQGSTINHSWDGRAAGGRTHTGGETRPDACYEGVLSPRPPSSVALSGRG